MGNEQGSTLNREPLTPPCQLQWDTVKSERAEGREGHASAVLNNKVYFYGGMGLTHLYQLSVFDIEDGKWREIHSDVGPGPLCNATLNTIDSKLYLFGGLNRETGWNNDVWAFDTDTEKWEKVRVTGIAPSPRDKHSAVVRDNTLVVFGGFGPAPECGDSEESEDEGTGGSINFTWFNDLSIFDTETRVWTSPTVSLIGGPVARAAHVATLYKGNMIVFGGKDSKARNQDLYKLDLDSLEWSKLEDYGERPGPCSFHCAVQYKQYMLVYGGRFNDNQHSGHLHVLDCETGGWYKPISPDTPPPTPRGQSTVSVLADSTLVMFGGSSKFDPMQQCCQEFDRSVYKLNCTELKSVAIPPPPPPELPTEEEVTQPVEQKEDITMPTNSAQTTDV